MISKNFLFVLILWGVVFSSCKTSPPGNDINKDPSAIEFPLDKWERNLQPVLKGFMHAYQPCVVETGNKEYPYMMWFFGWIEDMCNSGYPGIDANHVPQAFVCNRENKWWLYLFYSTQVGWRDNGIDYKLFEEGEEYNWFYDEIRYMRQEITFLNE